MRSVIRFLAAAALVAAVAGCSTDEPSTPVEDPAVRFGATMDRALSEAKAQGASPEQLAVLAASQKSGTLTFEQYQTATLKTLACVKAAGIDVDGPRTVRRQGITILDFATAASSTGRSDEQTDALAEQCRRRHSLWIDLAYNNSPASLEAKESDFAPYRKAFVECLTKNHVVVDESTYAGDLFTKAAILQQKTSVDCVGASGFPADQGFTW